MDEVISFARRESVRHSVWLTGCSMGALQQILEAKGIPAAFDYWGRDVEHHWYWWQKMLGHHLRLLWQD